MADTPTGLTATTISATRIDLSWTSAETKFELKRERWNGTAWDSTTTFTDILTTSYSDTTVDAATYEYRYAVRSVEEVAAGQWTVVGGGATESGSATSTLLATDISGGGVENGDLIVFIPCVSNESQSGAVNQVLATGATQIADFASDGATNRTRFATARKKYAGEASWTIGSTATTTVASERYGIALRGGGDADTATATFITGHNAFDNDITWPSPGNVSAGSVILLIVATDDATMIPGVPTGYTVAQQKTGNRAQNATIFAREVPTAETPAATPESVQFSANKNWRSGILVVSPS